MGEASQGFTFRILSFTSFLLPSGPLVPSSQEIRCNPENSSTQCLDKWNGISEWETRWKSGTMMGVNDVFSKILPSGKPKPTDIGLVGHPINPPKHGQVG
jgi:hypothetical protein